MKRLLAAALAAAGLLGAAAEARAAPPTDATRKAIIAPTLVGLPGSLHRPTDKDGELRAAAGAVDAQLADAAQDLGLAIDVGQAPLPDVGRASEADQLARAQELGVVLLLPSLRAEGGGIALRLAAADASGKVMHVRTARTTREGAAVQAAILLRDLAADLGHAPLRAAGGAAPPPPSALPAVGTAAAATGPTSGSTAVGRATLLVNATLFGGLVGFSIQKASGSNDPRLLYPLLAVGAGIGLGGSILITEEWSVTGADAWYLAAGMWWPTLAGHFVYAGRFSAFPEEDRWEFGLIGATTGITLASLGLALRPMSDGGAWLAHSGGALGVVFGGLGEFMGRGSIHETPFAGMGYGAGLGWLVAAAAATQVRPSPTRVLATDIGAFVGGLGGAALGSPLVFGKQDATKQRAWVGITGGTALAGGTLGFIFGKERGPTPKNAWLVPSPAVLGESRVGELRAPIIGLGWHADLLADGAPVNAAAR